MELAQAWNSDWTPTRPGTIQRTHRSAWAKLTPSVSGHSPHLSLSIDPSGLGLFGNIETEGPYRRFLSKWRQDPTGFISILRQLGSTWPPTSDLQSWRFRISRRIQIQAQKHDHWPYLDITATALSGLSVEQQTRFIDDVTQRPAGESYPQIMLIRALSPDVVVGDVNLAKRLASFATELEPLFVWLGDLVRTTNN